MPHAVGGPPMLCESASVGVLHLALAGLALQLLVVLVDHAHAGRAGRMAEGLEPAVGVHRQLAAELERAARDVLLRRALLAEAEVLVGEQLGQREAVVHLRDVDLLRTGSVMPGLRVDVASRRSSVGFQRRKSKLGSFCGFGASAMPITPFTSTESSRKLLREVGARDDRRRRAVGLRGAVVEAERPRDDARLEHVLDRDLALQHRLRRERAVVVVLDRDLREVLAAGAVRLEVASRRRARTSPPASRQAAHAGRSSTLGPGDAAVLRLVEADDQHRVVHARPRPTNTPQRNASVPVAQ